MELTKEEKEVIIDVSSFLKKERISTELIMSEAVRKGRLTFEILGEIIKETVHLATLETICLYASKLSIKGLRKDSIIKELCRLYEASNE